MDFSKLNKDVVFKKAKGKIIWQPRIDAWYRDRTFNNQDFLPEKYKGMSLKELYLDLGCSNRIYDFNECFTKVYDIRVKKTIVNHDKYKYEEIIETPVGIISQIMLKNDSNHGEYPVKWFLNTKEDFYVQMWLEEHTDIVFNKEKYDELLAYWGNIGAPQVFIDRVNIQKLFIELMGVENTIYALFDFPEVVEKYFEVLDNAQYRWIETYNKSPIEIINYGDNIHNGTLPPKLFEKYVLPVYQTRSKLWKNKFIFAHWDGDTKHILKYLKDTKLDGIEAITPLPQGDVTLEELKENIGEMVLLDGIPAILFDETYPISDLIEITKKIIDLFAPNLVLGISDEISSSGDIERVRVVGNIVDEYNKQFN
jgi:hypothetical protein